MRQIRNGQGKLVCEIDESSKVVAIVHKGFKTIVRFMADGRVVVLNTKPAA